MDARKERKARFDVPLPMRPTQRDLSIIDKQGDSESSNGPSHMKFGLLTKRGNKQQVGHLYMILLYLATLEIADLHRLEI
jgi:hypothetical protein